MTDHAPDALRPARAHTPDEQRAFLAAQDATVAAQLRRMRDACYDNPELMATYGFASVKHAPTVGLLAYAQDEVRRAAWLAIRDEIARKARGG